MKIDKGPVAPARRYRNLFGLAGVGLLTATVALSGCRSSGGSGWPVPSNPGATSSVPAPTTGPTTPRPTVTSPPSGTKTRQQVTATIKVGPGQTYDGRNKLFVGAGKLGGGGQEEGQDPIFELADGAKLVGATIGSPAADGVHCLGSCTLEGVGWDDVGEDAATLKGSNPNQVMTINGGYAKKAADKVFQHNGPGTMVITGGFTVEDFGKLYRSCGNCKTQFARHVEVRNVIVKAPGKALVGINPNLGDTATISGVTIYGDSGKKIGICTRYKGVTSGEPQKVGSGPDGKSCKYSESDITYR